MKVCKQCGLDEAHTEFVGDYNYCNPCHLAHRGRYKTKRKPASQPTVVYFIRSGDLIKIGYTGDLTERVRTMQVNNPTIVEVLKTIPGGYPEEQQLHCKFIHLNKQGEWFYAVQELIDYISSLS